MVRFYSRPAVPSPDDLCLTHTAPPEPLRFRPSPLGWWSARRDLPEQPHPGLFLGDVDGRPLWAVGTPVPPGEEWTTLRTLLADADPDQRTAAVRAAELASWVRDHRFCGVCGTPTRRNEAHVSFGCPACGAEFWPRVTPAVIMLVHRGDEVLLARHVRYTGPVFSCVAGFVEAGETLEEAVAREVMEEVGVVVGPPAYVGSQAWPFPHSLMTGFFAPWVSGEPVPDGHEIAEARWFRRDTLPQLPPALSIARGLVRKFFGDHAL